MSRNKRGFSRRESQIMDVIYARGEATAADVTAALPDAPSYSAIRALLRILEGKGMLTRREKGPRYVYTPTVPREQAGKSELRRVLDTFFAGSLANAVAALVEAQDAQLPPDELDCLETIVRNARETWMATPYE